MTCFREEGSWVVGEVGVNFLPLLFKKKKKFLRLKAFNMPWCYMLG